MILSSTRSANHNRVESAGDSAGQPLNRVFERHKMIKRQMYGRAGLLLLRKRVLLTAQN